MIFRLINCFTLLAIFALGGNEVVSQAVRQTQTRKLGPGKTHFPIAHSHPQAQPPHEEAPSQQPDAQHPQEPAIQTALPPAGEPAVHSVPAVENPSVSAPVANQPTVEEPAKASVAVVENPSVTQPPVTQTIGEEPGKHAEPLAEQPPVQTPVQAQTAPVEEAAQPVASQQPAVQPAQELAIQSTLPPTAEPSPVPSVPAVENPSVSAPVANQPAVDESAKPTVPAVEDASVSPPAVTPAPVADTTVASIDFEQAKTDIVRNIKRQYNILRNLTNDYKDVFAKESSQASGIYKNLTKSLSWYFSEPDEPETKELDAILSEFYPFGSKDTDYVDSMERMDKFCDLREKRLDSFKSWIRRKYRYNMVVQVALNMLVARIESKTDYYCNATAHREAYVKHMSTAKTINHLLVNPKNQLIDTAILIQNSEYQLPKVGRLCCAFWGFFRQLLLNIKSSASVDFVVEMTRHYFSSSTRYICFLYPYGSELCKEEEPAPKVAHKYESIVLEGAITIGEIATP